MFTFTGNSLPYVIREVDLALVDGPKDFLIVLSIKWRLSAKQDIHDDATAPDIAFAVIGLLQDFWSNIIRCSYGLGKLLIWVKFEGSSKINYL
jgi:hypothetical protein